MLRGNNFNIPLLRKHLLAVVWNLSIVVSILEAKSGVEAFGKASQLLKGMKMQGCKQSHVEEIELQGGLDLEYTKLCEVHMVDFVYSYAGDGQCREKEGDGDDFFSCSGKNMDKTNKEVKCLL
ncbi:hypothetical protein G2W53_007776 [Senna tora]|uniref:Uncharacterized protein n=1 Tax=Senna tora TaxID=362788 RepID=A0A835CEK4_9FABA|nr:hypothetical protein G2W53_007776 [Senna tora]